MRLRVAFFGAVLLGACLAIFDASWLAGAIAVGAYVFVALLWAMLDGET